MDGGRSSERTFIANQRILIRETDRRWLGWSVKENHRVGLEVGGGVTHVRVEVGDEKNRMQGSGGHAVDGHPPSYS